jgi:hypothetical protein
VKERKQEKQIKENETRVLVLETVGMGKQAAAPDD